MITSIVMKGKHKIGLDSYNKFVVDDIKVSVKEVPFVRYRFEGYGEDEIKYIKKMKEQFKYSSHLAEITIGKDTAEVIKKLDDIDNLIKFVYVPISDKDVDGGLEVCKRELIADASEEFYDRLMIRDESDKLDAVTSIRLKKDMANAADLGYNDIGVCQSPLSFDGKNACLTAVRARELSAEYAENDEVALPTANHESMNCCGCIKYIEIAKDIEVQKSSKSKGSGSPGSTKRSKRVKQKKSKGIRDWNF